MSLVTCTVTDGVAQVRLARPEKLNALTLDVLEELVATAHRLRGDRELRAVVLAGEGDSFCAGLDFATVLKEPVRVAGAFVPRPWRGTNTFQEACWAWRRIPVPVIAAVHGHALGGGIQIALGADIRIAAPDARFGETPFLVYHGPAEVARGYDRDVLLDSLCKLLEKSTVRGSNSLSMSKWIDSAYESYIRTFKQRSLLIKV